MLFILIVIVILFGIVGLAIYLPMRSVVKHYTKDFTYFKAEIPIFIPENNWVKKEEVFNLPSFENVNVVSFHNNFIDESESYDTQRSGPVVTETKYINKKDRVEFIYYAKVLNDGDYEKLKEELFFEIFGFNLSNMKKVDSYDENSFIVKLDDAIILKSFESIRILP